MTAFQIYIILQLDQIGGALTALGGMMIIASVFWMFFYSLEKDKIAGIMKTGLKPVLIAASISITIATFLPTTKTAITMLVAPQILKDETVRELPSKVLELIDSKLDSLLASEENSK